MINLTRIIALTFFALCVDLIIVSVIIFFSSHKYEGVTKSKRYNIILGLLELAFIFFILTICFAYLNQRLEKGDSSNIETVKVIGMTFYNESNDELMVSFKTDNNLIVNIPVDSDKIICDIQTDISYYKYNSKTNSDNKIGLTLDTYKLFIDENNRNYMTIN